MDPLIELSEPAKARIKTREAQAKHELDKVRQACESDIANAQRQWGGYSSLFKDNLSYVFAQTDATMRQAESLCAQYVFNVHAVEYRAVLPNTTELELILAKLRETVIRQYGEHARAGVRVMETHELELASAGNIAAPKTPGTQGSVNVPSWIELHAQFLRYVADHTGVSAIYEWIYPEPVMMAAMAESAATGEDPLTVLRKIYQNPDVSARPQSPKGQWRLEGGSSGTQHLFRVIAGRAAGKLPNVPDAEPWHSWLDHLRAEGYSRKMPDRRIQIGPGLLQRANPTVPYPPGFEDQKVENIFQGSADFCFARSFEETALVPNESAAADNPGLHQVKEAHEPADAHNGSNHPSDKSASSDGQADTETAVSRPPIYDRVSPDDLNYDLLKRSFMTAWADSHGLVADGWAGQVSLSDYVEKCVNTFDQGAQVHVSFQDATPISERCNEIDRMADGSVAIFCRSIAPESERLGQPDVAAAVEEYSRRIREIAARSKQSILLGALSAMPDAKPDGGSEAKAAPLPGASSPERSQGQMEGSSPTTIHEADAAESSDPFVLAYREIAAKSEETLAAFKRKVTAPKKRALYRDVEHSIWSAWQIRPADVTVLHINHALHLLARNSEGGVELDPVSVEAYGIDYPRLTNLMQASILRGGDMSSAPKVPRRSDLRAVTGVPAIADGPESPESREGGIRSGLNAAAAAKQARAVTVARVIKELDQIKPQMFEDESEYKRIREFYPAYIAFSVAENRPDLKQKILAIRGSARHIRLAQEIAAAHHGRELTTIQDDWKDHKPPEFKRQR